MSAFLEDLGRHVAGRTACSGQNVKLLLVHDPGQSEICDQQVGVIFWCSEEEVLGLEIAMYDAMIMEIGYSGKRGTDKVGGIGFVV